MQIHIKVIGRVQGVGYRAWTARQAKKLNLTGFVRNRRDKSVEIWAEGEIEAVNALLEMCLKGPSWARVETILPQSYPDAPMPQIKANIFESVGTV